MNSVELQERAPTIRLPERPPATGSIMFVCTANVTRSAFMHLALRPLLVEADLERVNVRSAGLQAVEGDDPHPQVRAWLERRGIYLDDFVARRLIFDDVAAADLVITATRRQRDLVVRTEPRSSTKVFTLLQLDRLIGGDPEGTVETPTLRERPTTYVARLAASRRGLGGGASETDDLADPTGERSAAFTAMFNQVHPVLHNLVAHLKAHQQHSMGEEQA